MGVLRCGTSSWSEKSWVGNFYPTGTPPGEFLTHYATQFDTVEADVTYYRIPDARLVDGWNAKTPDGFTLSAKFPRSVVHGGDDAKPDPHTVLVPDAVADDVDRFLRAMSRLGPKLGPLVLQFPYFNRQVFASGKEFVARLEVFLQALPREGFRYAVEIRNKQWVTAEFLDLLRSHNVAFVLVDLLYMPHPAELAERFDLITADFSYARLIGDRKAVDEASGGSFDRIVVDQSERLARWAKLIETHLAGVAEVFAYANNHYAGHAPATIRDLADRVGR